MSASDSVLGLAHWAARAFAQYDAAAVAALSGPAPENWVDARGLEIPLPLGVLVAEVPDAHELEHLVGDVVATRNALVVVSDVDAVARAVDEISDRLTGLGAPAGLIQVVSSLGDHDAARVIRPRRQGAVPVLVDASADLEVAAQTLSGEMQVIAEEPIADALARLAGPDLVVERVPDVTGGIRAVAAAVRSGSPGGTVVVHTRDGRLVMRLAAALGAEVSRFVVNAALAPNHWDYDGPGDLVRWVRVLGSPGALTLPSDWGATAGRTVPPYPVASNLVVAT